jgi:hypothetical protein
MGRSPDRLTPQQRDVIYELKHQGKSGREVSEIVAAGYGEVKPFTVSGQHANDLYRAMAEQRGELYETQLEGLTTTAAIRKLQARGLRLAERELARQETRQARGKLDPAQLGKVAVALERFHRLDEALAVPPPPTAKKDGSKAGDGEGEQASAFATRLAEGAGEDAEPSALAPAPVADLPISEGGKVAGRPPVVDEDRLALAREARG